jgi:hypothetical protein
MRKFFMGRLIAYKILFASLTTSAFLMMGCNPLVSSPSTDVNYDPGINLAPTVYGTPGAPTGLAASPSSGNLALTWNAPSGNFGALTYIVLRGSTSGGETVLASGQTLTSYSDSAVTNGTTYYYEVEAVGSGGTSAASNEISAIPNNTATHLAFSTQPGGTVAVGSNLTQQPTVQALNSSGSVVASYVTAVTLAAFTDAGCTVSAGGTLGGSATTTAGVAAFSGVTFNEPNTIYLQATSGGLTTACSSAHVQFTASSPTVTAILPVGGTIAGGTSVTITGTNFYPGASVTIGGTACTSLTVTSQTQITCTTGAHAVSQVAIQATNTDSNSGSLSAGYSYWLIGSVAAVYPTNGANWNDYVKWSSHGGSNTTFNQTDTACAGTEQNYLYGCIHGGEKRQVTITGYSTCTGLTGADSLGVFKWGCSAASGTATFYSQGFQTGKGLRDLLSSSAWKNNSFSASSGSEVILTTPSTAWWSNPIATPAANPSAPLALTNTGTGSTGGTIYVVSANTSTAGYDIYNTPKISLVTLAGITVTYNGYATAWCQTTGAIGGGGGNTALLCVGGSNFVWIEGNFIGVSSTIPTYLAGLFSTNFDVINKSQFSLAATCVHMGSGVSDYMENSQVSKCGTSGIDAYNTYSTYYQVLAEKTLTGLNMGSNNIFINFTASIAADYGVSAGFGPSYNTMVGTTVFNTAQQPIKLDDGVTGNTFLGTVASSNGASYPAIEMIGISLNTVTGNSLTNTAVLYSGGIGLDIDYASSNDFNDIILDANVGIGISLGQTTPANTNNNTFQGLIGFNTASASCGVGTGTTGNQLLASCAHGTGTSTAALVNLSVANSLIGAAPSDSSNAQGATGSSAYGSITDWMNFQNIWRGWGLGGGTFLSSGDQGTCSSGTCQIFDYRTKASTTGYMKNYYSAFTNGTTCPSSVDPTQAGTVITDHQTTPRVFLKSATEVMDPVLNPTGNFDGLCETGEMCVYSPNLGSYQGEGDFTTQSCTFNGGNGFAAGTMYGYPTNGG